MPEKAMILLADDEAMVRNFLHAVLKKIGCIVLEAANGKEALEISRRHKGRIDLLITDILMPEMDGCELIEKITKERPDLRILVVTGNGYEEFSRLHLNIPCLKKPFTPCVFSKKVREILGRPAASGKHLK